MRLAISNIAWDVDEDGDVALLLRKYGVDAIDVAPSKYFRDSSRATERDIARVREWWTDRGIELTGMQALLFGTSGLNVFGPPEVQAAMLAHLAAVCRVGAGLGATRLVFGSPRNRDRSGLPDDRAMDAACAFFARLGDVAQSHGVFICLEPNPASYGANFMTTSFETAQVVDTVAHRAIRMQFDTGASMMNGEDAEAVLEGCAGLIGHVHASEPDLQPLGDGGVDHVRIHALLDRYVPGHVVSIEMVATQAEPHMRSIERALRAAVRAYRAPERAGR